MADSDLRNHQIRHAAFAFLERATSVHGDVLPWSLLKHGFDFQGERIHLVQMQGIFKPKALTDGPISIRTAQSGPYDDRFTEGEHIQYAYRGTDPTHHDNRALRQAMTGGVPLIYFISVEHARYFTAFPAFIIGEDPRRKRFVVQVDEQARVHWLKTEVARDLGVADDDSSIRRRYATRQTLQRLHQQSFRERVPACL